MGADPLMAGNSQRRGRTTGAGKKTATAGTGGKNRRALAGRGATPPAEARPGHPAQRRAAADQRARADRARARARSEETPELLLGRNPVVEALRARVPAAALHVAIGIESDMRVSEAIKLAGDQRVPIIESSRSELDRFTERAMHQGLALQVPPYDYQHPDDLLSHALEQVTPALVIALDGVTDPRNLGAIVRACDGAGADGLVLPRHGSAGVTSIVAKASAGAVEHVRIAMTTNLAELLRRTKRPDLWSYAADAEGGAAPWEIDMTSGTIFVLGSEGSGIRPLVQKLCDASVTIPQAGRIASLNVAVAAGTLLYEAARQRALASRD
jgi:23S rRNA (guanosine2251-2'-O)-methyltransferase